jgi:hypothetical protein
MSHLKIAKLEAAKRQLETAILLYFNDKDPISIHTLVGAAHEVIADLNKKAGGSPLILEGAMIKNEYKREFLKVIREAKNFFKHADKDHDETVDFNPEVNDFYLLDACEGYQLLTGEKNPYFIIYRGWFHYIHPGLIKDATGNEIVKNLFGDNKIKYFSAMLSASTVLQ